MTIESRTITLTSPEGLHARPANRIAGLAAESGCIVTLSKNGTESIDASSVLRILALGAAHGDTLKVSVEGEDPGKTLAHITQLIAEGDQL